MSQKQPCLTCMQKARVNTAPDKFKSILGHPKRKMNTSDNDPRMISLVLTHYNRYAFLLECLMNVIDDPRINEIVISDDASTDGSWERLRTFFLGNPKVKLFRNEVNLDCYANKAAAMRRATNDWCILFDSDNILTRAYLDKLYSLPLWDYRTAYCPEWAEPHFDYRAFSGLHVSRSNVAAIMEEKHFSTALNTCNYFINRNMYLLCWDGSVNPHTADSMFHMLNWLKANNSLVILEGLRYFHRVHPGSHYKQNVHKTGDFASQVETQLKQLR